MAGWVPGPQLGILQGSNPNQGFFNMQFIGQNVSPQYGPGYQINPPQPPPPPPPSAPPVTYPGNVSMQQYQQFQDYDPRRSENQTRVPGPSQNFDLYNPALQNTTPLNTVVSTHQIPPPEAHLNDFGQSHSLKQGPPDAIKITNEPSDKFSNCSQSREQLPASNDDSGSSIGGSCSDLTGDEDDEDPLQSKAQPRNYQEKLRQELLKRENQIITFWLARRPISSKSFKFPDVYRLRNIKNLDKKAKSAFESLFAKCPRHLKPEFVKAANTRPDLGYFHVRCSWNSFQHTVHGYGNTVEAAENDAGIKALVTVFGEEEYSAVNEITQDSLFGYEGLDMTRIHSHLSLRNRKEPQSFGKGSPTFEYELTSQPSILKLNSVPGAPDFSVPKSQFTLSSKKIPLYGKDESRIAPASNDNLILLQSIKKLSTFSNLSTSAVPALGSLFVGDLEPSPKYTTFSSNGHPNSTVKVECVANKKYFVAEATTEEAAKNAAALKALKFIIGAETFDRLASSSQ